MSCDTVIYHSLVAQWRSECVALNGPTDGLFYSSSIVQVSQGDAPFYLSLHFTKVQHRYSTRQSLGDLCVPRPNIELFKQYYIKVQFYGTILAMVLNVAVISCLLNDRTNRNCNVLYNLFMPGTQGRILCVIGHPG